MPTATPATKIDLEFLEITQRLKQCQLPTVDHVVGIGSGGIVIASLVAYQIDRPLTILPINYRHQDNTPKYEQPKFLGHSSLGSLEQRLLLVDDVSVSGQTLALAKTLLAGHDIITLVLKGRADIVLFSEVDRCVHWPWNPRDVSTAT